MNITNHLELPSRIFVLGTKLERPRIVSFLKIISKIKIVNDFFDLLCLMSICKLMVMTDKTSDLTPFSLSCVVSLLVLHRQYCSDSAFGLHALVNLSLSTRLIYSQAVFFPSVFFLYIYIFFILFLCATRGLMTDLECLHST